MTDAQIFQIVGIMYLTVGLGILINPDFYKKMITSFMQSPPVIYLGGLTALLIGYLLVTFHNVWVKDWAVIITIVGWLAIIKGLMLIVLPKVMVRISNAFVNVTNIMKIWPIIIIILGALCCWLGFFAL